ncbi:MAG: hypothetical protein Q9159_003459 [Coniocarpon cinnabarinum]
MIIQDHLHSRGAYVAILDLNEDNGAETLKELGGDARAKFWECDVSDSGSMTRAVAGVLEWIKGTGKEIGGVVAAAGVGFPGKVLDRELNPLNLDNFDRVVKINLHGSVDLVRQLLPSMAQNKPTSPDGERGVLILVSSVAAYDGQPGQLAYSASKGAIRSLVLPLARDLAPFGIRAVAIAPGVFASSMTAAMSDKVRKSLEGVMEWPKRMGTPQEFAMLARQVVENPMLNADTIRLDAAVRMPSKM